MVNQAIRLRFLRIHEVIPVRIALDRFDRLTGTIGKDLIQLLLEVQDFVRLDLNIARRTADGS